MIPFEVIIGASVGVGMAAGYVTGVQKGVKEQRRMAAHMTRIFIGSTSALARGAVAVLMDKLNMEELQAVKILMDAAGKAGFAGIVMDVKTGEIVHGNNQIKQK